MYPKPIIQIGTFEVNLYGICFAIGIVVCLVLMLKLTKKKGMSPQAQNFFYFTAIGAIVVGYFFAALFQAVYNFIENPSAGFEFGGITFLGGLIGGIGSFLLIYYIWGRKKYRGDLPRIIEVAPCVIAIAHFFGRIGCFFSGCCHGAVTDSWLGIAMPGSNPYPQKVYPVQLFEAIFLLILFLVCLYLYLKDYHITMTVYLAGYGIWRFLIEFLRADDRGDFVPGISPSQFWSLWMIVAAIVLVCLRIYLKRKKNYDLWI